MASVKIDQFINPSTAAAVRLLGYEIIPDIVYGNPTITLEKNSRFAAIYIPNRAKWVIIRGSIADRKILQGILDADPPEIDRYSRDSS